MRQPFYCTLVAIVTLCAPALGESRSFPGTVEITTESKRAGEECETGAKAECKVGDLCYANLMIQGEAARVLYEALKIHGAPSGAIGDFATRSEVLVRVRSDRLLVRSRL